MRQINIVVGIKDGVIDRKVQVIESEKFDELNNIELNEGMVIYDPNIFKAISF